MADRKPLPSVNYLLECFRYNPATGDLIWRKRPLSHFKNEASRKKVNAWRAGERAGTLRDGCLEITLAGKMFRAHRLIFKMHYGWCPTSLTHIDGNPTNNRIENLRKPWTGIKIRGKPSRYRGVSAAVGEKWQATIRVSFRARHLGNFPDEISAALAYDDAAKFYFGKHAVLNFPPAPATVA